jgi:hypothetical protein
MAKPGNVVVAQSGGPTPVINSSLRGIVETCRTMPEHFGTVLAGRPNSERSFPDAWITVSRTDVTDDLVRYARPLIGDWPSVPTVDGRQRFARLRPVLAERQLPGYVPQTYRKEQS